jgi:hypothetical protein
LVNGVEIDTESRKLPPLLLNSEREQKKKKNE